MSWYPGILSVSEIGLMSPNLELVLTSSFYRLDTMSLLILGGSHPVLGCSQGWDISVYRYIIGISYYIYPSCKRSQPSVATFHLDFHPISILRPMKNTAHHNQWVDCFENKYKKPIGNPATYEAFRSKNVPSAILPKQGTIKPFMLGFSTSVSYADAWVE